MAKQEGSTVSATAPAAAPASDGLQSLVAMIHKAGPEAKEAMRSALGVGKAIQPPKNQQSNADAKRIAYSVGEIVHPEGFLPKPSEHLVEQGPEAVAEWQASWLARNRNPSSKAEEYAAVAVE